MFSKNIKKIIEIPNITILGLGYLSSFSGTCLTPKIKSKYEKSSQGSDFKINASLILQNKKLVTDFFSFLAHISPSDICRKISKRRLFMMFLMITIITLIC